MATCQAQHCDAVVLPEHNPCCSSHGQPLCCEHYCRFHFVEIHKCSPYSHLAETLRAWADETDRRALLQREQNAGRLADNYRQQGRALGWNDCASTVRRILAKFEAGQ